MQKKKSLKFRSDSGKIDRSSTGKYIRDMPVEFLPIAPPPILCEGNLRTFIRTQIKPARLHFKAVSGYRPDSD
jgi:hypothetical protein